MSTSVDNCGICFSRHVSNLSFVWCSDCDEGLCRACNEHHSLSKASRNHSIVPIDEYQKLPSLIANIKLHCDKHDEKYQLFCKGHNEVLCRKCVISEQHRNCTEIFPIEDVIRNIKASVAFTEVESSIMELGENLTLILKDRQKNLSSIAASKNKIESEISAIRQQINQHLDSIQDHFIDELNKAAENSTQQIQVVIASLAKNQTEIEKCIEDIESIKKHATDMQTFLGIRQLETKLHKAEKKLKRWISSDSLAYTNISFQLNTALQNISDKVSTFAKTTVNIQPCSISLHRKKEIQAQLMKVNVEPENSFKNITLKLKTKINSTAVNASGCCILPCGKLVVSNFHPTNLILFAPDGKFEKNFQSSMETIRDVTYVDNENIAVISSTQKNIELISLKLRNTFKTVNTSFPSCGITYNEGKFIVSPNEGQLQEIRLKDTKTSGVGTNMISIGVASLNDTIYSVKRGENTIVSHNKHGNILWTFTNEMILRGISGITVDAYGNVFVAGGQSKNVIAIAHDGKMHKILLSEADLYGLPWAIHYNSELKSLLIANGNSGQVLLYSVNYS